MTNQVEKLLNELIQKGKKQGYLHSDYLNFFVEDDNIDIDEIFVTLMKERIQVLDDDLDSEIYNKNILNELNIKERTGSTDESSEDIRKYSIDIRKIYLNEISEYELLDSDKEIELAKQIEKGIKTKELLDDIHKNVENNKYSLEELKKFQDDVENGKKARELFIYSNLKLSYSIALRFQNRGLSVEDLISEGNSGVVKAVDRYDYTKGIKFSTYATYWIKQAIQRAIYKKGRSIYLPENILEQIRELNSKKDELFNKLRREPTYEELASALKIHPIQVLELLRFSQETTSLDNTVGDDDSTLIDLVTDDEVLSPLENLIKSNYNEEINKIFSLLTPQEAVVLKYEFGFIDSKTEFEKYGINEKNQNKIMSNAIKKLHHPDVYNRLLKFKKMDL